MPGGELRFGGGFGGCCDAESETEEEGLGGEEEEDDVKGHQGMVRMSWLVLVWIREMRVTLRMSDTWSVEGDVLVCVIRALYDRENNRIAVGGWDLMNSQKVHFASYLLRDR